MIFVFFYIVSCAGPSRDLIVAGKLDDLHDREPIPEPELRSPNQYYDFIDRAIFKQVHSIFDLPRHVRAITAQPKQAINVDAFDEVPNSTWFTNRAYRITYKEALNGPNEFDGPDMSAPWIVKGVKTQGITPGFRIKDRQGDIYLLKFDPISNPELATGAEIISTKLCWAIGYNTPENYLVFFKPEQLLIKGEVKLVDEFGYDRILKPEDVTQILTFVPKLSDGRIRAVASRFLPGKPIGPYSYFGTRPDDSNDVFRHEHRRDLRGLYVFVSLINHNDIRRINSLDMYCSEGYIKHYLIDFGSTLGSGATSENLRSEGFQYQLDYGEIAKAFCSFGMYTFPWQRMNLESGFESIGYFSGKYVNPGKWKPNYPNLAFQRLTNRDGYWGAKIVMSLTDEIITGIVKQAQYSDKDAEKYMTNTLIQRKNTIGKYWYQQVSPLDWFKISNLTNENGQFFSFTDLAIYEKFENQENTRYKIELKYNKATGSDPSIFDETVINTGKFLISPEIVKMADKLCINKKNPNERLFYIQILTQRKNKPDWKKIVKVHLLFEDIDSGFKIAGIERK